MNKLLALDSCYFIDSVYLTIAMKNISVIKTKYQLQQLLYSKFKSQIVGKSDPVKLLGIYKSCVDVQAILSYFLGWMKVIEVDYSFNSGPVTQMCLNNLTDATCIMD